MARTTWKPEGYGSLSPYLVVEDAEAVLGFAAAVFGAERLRVIRDGAGAIRHAECRIDDSVLMMGQMPGGGPAAHLHVYVPDAAAAHARALDAGAAEVEPVADRGDGESRGGVRDGQGVSWWISSRA